MANDKAFLETIIAEPGDDAVRLIYADWLEEQDGDKNQRRGQFIRADIAREQKKPYSPEWQPAMTERNLALCPDGSLGEDFYNIYSHKDDHWFPYNLKISQEVIGAPPENSAVFVKRGFIEGLDLQGKFINHPDHNPAENLNMQRI